MSFVVGATAVLLIGAIGALALFRWPRLALATGLAAVVGAGALVLVAAAAVLAQPASIGAAQLVSWPMPLGTLSLAVDGLSAWFLLSIGLLSIAAGAYSWGYMRPEAEHRPVGLFAALLCVLVASIVVVFCAADAVLFLVAWELLSLSAFFLVGFDDRKPEVRKAALTYLVATHIGTAIGVYPLFALLVGQSGGDTSFAALAAAGAAAGTTLAVILFVLGLIGFGTKAGFMPMHVWLPVAHPVAPSPVSALMSGVVIKCGIYGLLRTLSWLPALPQWCAILMLAVGGVSGIMGILYSLSQQQLKRMLAYSSVENIGIIGLGIGIGMLGRALGNEPIAALGFAGALLHVLNHSLFKGLLFLSAGTVVHGTGTGDIERLGGLAKKTPANAALFVLAAAAICALPPLNGFVSEWLIYRSLFEQTIAGAAYASAASVAGITALALIGALALTSFARVTSVVFLGEPRDREIHPHATPASMVGGMGLLGAACVGVGLLSWFGPVVANMLRPPVGVVTRGGAGGAGQLLGGAAGPVAIFILLAAGLAALRWKLLAKARPPTHLPTWGCGYAFPTARMQYTGSSFGWSLVAAFQQVLRPKQDLRRPEGFFPVSGQLSTCVDDAAMSRGFEPIFAAVRRLCDRIRPLQRGRIQLCLIYVVATLMIVLAVEAWRTPFAPATPKPQSPPAASHEVKGGPSPTVSAQGEHR